MTLAFIQVYHTRSWIWIISSLFLLLRVNAKVQDRLGGECCYLPNRTKKHKFLIYILSFTTISEFNSFWNTEIALRIKYSIVCSSTATMISYNDIVGVYVRYSKCTTISLPMKSSLTTNISKAKIDAVWWVVRILELAVFTKQLQSIILNHRYTIFAVYRYKT